MKRTSIIAVAAFAAAVAAGNSRPAQAYNDEPWCAVINLGFDVHWDCSYASYEQCYPNVLAGNRGFCNLNPAYTGVEQGPRGHYTRRHVRHRVRHD